MFIIELIACLQVVVASPNPGLKLTVKISASITPITCKTPNVIKEGQKCGEGLIGIFCCTGKKLTYYNICITKTIFVCVCIKSCPGLKCVDHKCVANSQVDDSDTKEENAKLASRAATCKMPGVIDKTKVNAMTKLMHYIYCAFG